MQNTLLTFLLVSSYHTALCMQRVHTTGHTLPNVQHGVIPCPTYTPSFPLDVALANGDPNQVMAYYSNWQGTYSPAEYAACIATTLCQTAQRPQKVTGKIIPLLLEMLDPDHLDRIDCLFEDAIDNGHIELIRYIRTRLSSKSPDMQSALIKAIDTDQGDPIRVSNLLEAGVAPDEKSGCFPLHRAAYTGKSVIVDLLLMHNASTTRLNNNRNLPIFAALHGFEPGDSRDTISQRLRIVQRLLQKMPEHARPIGIEANLCKIPQRTRIHLMEILNEFPTIPKHICMTDDDDKALSKQHVDTLEFWIGWGYIACVSLATCICNSLAKKVYDQDKKRK